MSDPIKIGIIGLGKMGDIRARTVRENENTMLVCGTDPNPPTKGFEDMQLLPDYQAVIESDVDAVFVCTPNRFIPDIVVAALDAGKHVFCEKPPGRNLQDVERILEAERRNPGLVLKVGFNHRYHYGIMEAKKIVDSGKYGRIMWIRGIYGKAQGSGNPNEWRNDPEMAGGGILLDQGIHMLDLFRYFGGEFTEIKSMCTTAFWDIPVEDNAFALLRNENCIAMLHSSFTQWKHRFTLEIFMEDGYVIVDGMPSSTRSYRDEWIIQARRGTGFAIGNPVEERTFCNTDPSWELELAEFVESIRTGKPLKNGTSRDAYETMKLVFGIYEADESFRNRTTKTDKPIAEQAVL
ncbi:MAG: Gfo/Idh/MocA family oxidoreductase [candidate division KSB1 bacterium]|nr:Gfo/Idh/MocA family oxidoreductase [candidate division KSB1 bacterium]MDQ7062918.1 Gfo/Idh/MocA family oxidoreductase [candidate division KSB1 bacterium]